MTHRFILVFHFVLSGPFLEQIRIPALRNRVEKKVCITWQSFQLINPALLHERLSRQERKSLTDFVAKS